MGKGFLYGSSGGKAKKTPVLSTSYPANATVEINNSVTCEVRIATAGYPEVYSYQWYKNGTAVSGATGDSYTFAPTAAGSTTVYCKVTNAAGTVTSRTATITANPVYLYNDGDECTGITGGWTAYAYKSGPSGSNATAPTVTKGDSSITVSQRAHSASNGTYTYYAGALFTEKAIDVSKYSTMAINVTAFSSTVTTDKAYLRISTAKANSYPIIAEVALKANGEHTIDLSQISETVYILVAIEGVEAKTTVTFDKVYFK